MKPEKTAVAIAITAAFIVISSFSNSLTVNGEHTMWIRQFSTTASEEALGVSASSSAVYIAGVTGGALPGQIHVGSEDMFIRKYSHSGDEIWTRQFGTSGHDALHDSAIDGNSLYVSGGRGAGGNHDAYLAKYDSDGNELWNRQFGSSSTEEVAYGVFVFGSDVYAAGETSGSLPDQTVLGQNDAFVRKYSSSGVEGWTRQFGTVKHDRLTSVAVDSSGVFVGGETLAALAGQTNSGELDAFIRKYDENGNVLWTKQFGTGGWDRIYDMSIFASRLYVFGIAGETLSGQEGSGDAFIRVYDSSGNVKWTTRFGVSIQDNGGISVDSTGVYIGGSTDGTLDGEASQGSRDAFIGKFSKAGDLIWFTQYGSSAIDQAFDVSVFQGGVYVAGDTTGELPDQTAGAFDDAYLAKLGIDNPQSPDFNGDGYPDLAVGVPSEDFGSDTASDAGAVNILYGSASGLQTTSPDDQFLTQDTSGLEDTPEAGDNFGYALASGDFNGDGYDDLAVGAPGESVGTIVAAGAVNVLYGSSAGLQITSPADQLWTQNSNGVDNTAESKDRFGSSMTAGDFNNDGYYDLTIGVPQEKISTAVEAGAVNVLYGSSAGLKSTAATDGTGRTDQFWHQGITNVEDSEESGDLFGYALNSGDFNGDGFGDLAVGVPLENVGSIKNGGMAHVLYGSLSGLQTTSPLDQLWSQNSAGVDDSAEGNPEGQEGDGFGISLVSGDFDNDGYYDLAIGAIYEGIVSSETDGAVNVLYGSPKGLQTSSPIDQFWHQNSAGVENNSEHGDHLGSSLAAGDFNGDGYDDLGIGVPNELIGESGPTGGQGAVNVLYGSSSGLKATAASDGSGRADQFWHQGKPDVEDAEEGGDGFGGSIVAADYNLDGYYELAIGVRGENLDSAIRAGAVSVLFGSSSGLQAATPADQFWSQGNDGVEDTLENEDGFGFALD